MHFSLSFTYSLLITYVKCVRNMFLQYSWCSYNLDWDVMRIILLLYIVIRHTNVYLFSWNGRMGVVLL